MRKVLLVLCLFLIVSTAVGQVVSIPDANLRAKIENALGKASGATISAADMAGLTRLEARNANINDLTGLEHATNLTRLSLNNAWVPGDGYVNSNSVSDLSPLAGLTQLTYLHLCRNRISDISAVRGLTHLEELNLSRNRISDISALSGLTNLNRLYLWGNRISDISAVRGLTQLTELYLDRNRITDLSPLVSNTFFGSGDEVDVTENPLSVTSHSTHTPALQGRGVDITFDAHGDTRKSATRITIGSSTSGDLSSGDVDYLVVTVNSSGTLTAYTTGTTDTVGFLESRTGNRLASNDDSSGNNFRVSHSVNSGTYYIRVRGFNGTATGSYTLHVTFEAEQ